MYPVKYYDNESWGKDKTNTPTDKRSLSHGTYRKRYSSD